MICTLHGFTAGVFTQVKINEANEAVKPWKCMKMCQHHLENILSHVDPAESWGSKGLTQTCWCSMMSGQGLQPAGAKDFQHMKNALRSVFHFNYASLCLHSILGLVPADVWHTWRKLKKIEQHEKGIKRDKKGILTVALANVEPPRHRWSRGCKRQDRQTTCRVYASLKLPPEYASSASQQSGMKARSNNKTGSKISKSNLDISDAKMITWRCRDF